MWCCFAPLLHHERYVPRVDRGVVETVERLQGREGAPSELPWALIQRMRTWFAVHVMLCAKMYGAHVGGVR